MVAISKQKKIISQLTTRLEVEKWWRTFRLLLLGKFSISAIRLVFISLAWLGFYQGLLLPATFFWPEVGLPGISYSLHPVFNLVLALVALASSPVFLWLVLYSEAVLERERLALEQTGRHYPLLIAKFDTERARVEKLTRQIKELDINLKNRKETLELEEAARIRLEKELRQARQLEQVLIQEREQLRQERDRINRERRQESRKAQVEVESLEQDLVESGKVIQGLINALTNTLPDISAAMEASQEGDRVPLGWEEKRKWDEDEQRWNTYLEDDPAVCYLNLEALRYNFVVVGPSGGGKNFNLVEPVISAVARSKMACVALDVKGDGLDRRKYQAHFSTRPEEKDGTIRYCLINEKLGFPEAAHQLAQELVLSGSRDRTPRYYLDTARKALATMLKTYYLVNDGWPDDLLPLQQYMVRSNSLQAEWQELRRLATNPAVEEAKRALAAETALALEEVQVLKRSTGDALGTLSNALGGFGSGEFRRLVTLNPERGYSMWEILNTPMTLRVGLRGNNEDDLRLGRVVITQFKNAVVNDRINRDYLKLLLVDEAGQLICEALRSGVPQVRGNRGGFFLVFQSLDQIQDEAAENVIFGSCRNRAFLRGLQGRDALRASATFGSVSVETQDRGFQERSLWSAGEIGQLPGYSALLSLYDPATGENFTKLARFFKPADRQQLDELSQVKKAWRVKLNPGKLARQVVLELPQKLPETEKTPAQPPVGTKKPVKFAGEL